MFDFPKLQFVAELLFINELDFRMLRFVFAIGIGELFTETDFPVFSTDDLAGIVV